MEFKRYHLYELPFPGEVAFGAEKEGDGALVRFLKTTTDYRGGYWRFGDTSAYPSIGKTLYSFEILATNTYSTAHDWVLIRNTRSRYFRDVTKEEADLARPVSRKDVPLYVGRKYKQQLYIELLKGRDP